MILLPPGMTTIYLCTVCTNIIPKICTCTNWLILYTTIMYMYKLSYCVHYNHAHAQTVLLCTLHSRTNRLILYTTIVYMYKLTYCVHYIHVQTILFCTPQSCTCTNCLILYTTFMYILSYSVHYNHVKLTRKKSWQG